MIDAIEFHAIALVMFACAWVLINDWTNLK